MQIVGERQLPEQPQLPPPTPLQTMIQGATGSTANAPPAEYVHRAVWKAGVMGSLSVLFAVLSVRLILLVAVSGAIWLTYLAVQSPDLPRLGALGIYCAAICVPLVWLSSAGR
jgi:hypothetical protein